MFVAAAVVVAAGVGVVGGAGLAVGVGVVAEVDVAAGVEAAEGDVAAAGAVAVVDDGVGHGVAVAGVAGGDAEPDRVVAEGIVGPGFAAAVAAGPVVVVAAAWAGVVVGEEGNGLLGGERVWGGRLVGDRWTRWSGRLELRG